VKFLGTGGGEMLFVELREGVVQCSGEEPVFLDTSVSVTFLPPIVNFPAVHS